MSEDTFHESQEKVRRPESSIAENFAESMEYPQGEHSREVKKSTQTGKNKSRKLSSFTHYGATIVVMITVLGVIFCLFLVKKGWLLQGNTMVERIVEKKLEETLAKYLDTEKNNENSEDKNEITEKEPTGEEMDGKRLNSQGEQVIEEEDKTEYVLEANRLYEQKNYKQATMLYEKGLNKAMPFLNEDFLVYRLGDCYFNNRNYEEAIKILRTITNEYINSPYQLKSRFKIGECYAGMGYYRKARETLYSVVAQEGSCAEEDKSLVVESYFKIGSYYMKEAERLHKAVALEIDNEDSSTSE
ncbi:MAG: tetratricopeptide repeat protein [Candidatus Brocadiaceae bacterium]|nr:tetratricopeptide repeat protein [Candidatus Brocadiaceae bacterium]